MILGTPLIGLSTGMRVSPAGRVTLPQAEGRLLDLPHVVPPAKG
jgi:hypothetical protein